MSSHFLGKIGDDFGFVLIDQIEMWGAQGGDSARGIAGGLGAHTVATNIYLRRGVTYFIAVAGAGEAGIGVPEAEAIGGYGTRPNGAIGTYASGFDGGGAGGGASSVYRIDSVSGFSTYTNVAIAAGGGGAGDSSDDYLGGIGGHSATRGSDGDAFFVSFGVKRFGPGGYRRFESQPISPAVFYPAGNNQGNGASNGAGFGGGGGGGGGDAGVGIGIGKGGGAGAEGQGGLSGPLGVWGAGGGGAGGESGAGNDYEYHGPTTGEFTAEDGVRSGDGQVILTPHNKAPIVYNYTGTAQYYTA